MSLLICLLSATLTSTYQPEIVSTVSIRPGEGLVPAANEDNLRFGQAVAKLGPLQIAVSAPLANMNGYGRGCVYLLSLNEDGTVCSFHGIIGDEELPIQNNSQFGKALATVSVDSDDSTVQFAASMPSQGALYIITLSDDLNLRTHSLLTLSGLKANFTQLSIFNDPTEVEFGRSLTSLPDIDGNGADELVVGTKQGALQLHEVKVADNLFSGLFESRRLELHKTDGFACSKWLCDPRASILLVYQAGDGAPGISSDVAEFGLSLAAVPDLNGLSKTPSRYLRAALLAGDDIPDLSVGGRRNVPGKIYAGAVFLLMLASNGDVIANVTIDSTTGVQACYAPLSLPPTRRTSMLLKL
eukprot:1856869-Pleurochrysis_carterae.AAC.2